MTTAQQIDPSQIKEQVLRILKSPEFKRSKILSDFLKYVVRETLEGKGENLKEYVIATDVLNKSSDFNPQLDAVVRIHAGRLRNLLDKYYLEAGKIDALKISIPKGRYIPHFELRDDGNVKDETRNEDLEDLEIESIPAIAVLPFECLRDKSSGEVICSVMARDLTIGLSYFSELKVISNQAASYAKENLGNWKDIVSYLGADYIITGACLRDGKDIKVNVELHQNNENQVIWAESLLLENFDDSELKGYQLVVKKVLAKICGFLGIIYRSKLDHHIPKDFSTLYAVYWYNKFHQEYSYDGFQDALLALDKALLVNPENAMLNTLKAEVLLNLCFMDIEDAMDYFHKGSEQISKAINLDQNNQYAWLVMAWSKLLSSELFEFEQAVAKCLSINPYNPMYMGSVGFGYQCIGEYEKGLEMMLESIDLSPYYHWVINLGLCFYHLHMKSFKEALYWAKLIKRPGLFWEPLLQISILGHLNQAEDASELMNDFSKLAPNFEEKASYMVGRFILVQDLQDTILQGLDLAGIPMKPDS